MPTIVQFLLQAIPSIALTTIPGILIALALLRKNTNLHLFEILIIGVPIGFCTVGLLAWIEFLLGINYFQSLPFINITILTIAGIIGIYAQKIRILPKFIEKKQCYVWIILALILLLAWWIRAQATSPYFYEFDPYWYNTATQFILTQGYVPEQDDLAWWPNFNTHRTFVLVQYGIANWYSIFTFFNKINEFNFELMTMIATLYPPIFAALTCFFAYLLISRIYGRKLGLCAAVLLAFAPGFVSKTLAGEFELAPFGFFGIIAFVSCYYLTLKEKSKRLAILTGSFLLFLLLGAAGGITLLLIFAIAFFGLVLLYFIKFEVKKEFLELNEIIVAFSALAFLIYSIFLGNLAYALLLGLVSFSVGYSFHLLQNEAKSFEDKMMYISAVMVAGIIVLLVTPLSNVVLHYLGIFSQVVEYTAPTIKTIAEQVRAERNFEPYLGILGCNIWKYTTEQGEETVSITPIILVLTFLLILISMTKDENLLIHAIGIIPIAFTGFFKAKWVVYTGFLTPIAFIFLLGELIKILKWRGAQYALLLIALLVSLSYFFLYFETVKSSFEISTKADITNNTAFFASVCNKFEQKLQEAQKSKAFLLPHIARSILAAQQIYCTRIPDYWVEPLLWIRNNVGLRGRILSWWDYGHWITTFGQSKTVTDNTHAYMKMHEEVADKLVHNTPEALANYMKKHRAQYLLLDQDLIGKWSALVYHSCVYNNKSSLEKWPGETDCDVLAHPETIFIKESPTFEDSCEIKTRQGTIRGQKAYSTFARYYGFRYYCTSDLRKLYYENGTLVNFKDLHYLGKTPDGYLRFMITYSSDSPDKKGTYYDSIFYKGFFEGTIPGFEQVFPNVYAEGPKLPVRVYMLK